MDVKTAETIQALVRMIDNVNERNSLGRLALDGALVLLCSARRQGHLNEQEIKHMETVFADLSADPAVANYEKVRRQLEAAKAMWDHARPV
nr:hypothetical protein [Novosphingobium panipatense]